MPPKLMGADVAAGPHCPVAGTLPGRRGVPRRAVSSWRRCEPGARSAASSGVHPKPKLLQGFPAGSPTGPKPWRFAARQIWDLRPASRFGGPRPKPRFRVRQDPRPKPRFRLAVHEPKSRVRRFRSSRAETRSCPKEPGAEAQGSTGGGALTEIPLSAGQVLNPKVRCPACRFPTCPKAAGKPMGASRSMPLSHPLKGKPAASAWRRLRQPPCLSLRRFPPGETQSRSARAVAGKAIPRCRKIVSATDALLS